MSSFALLASAGAAPLFDALATLADGVLHYVFAAVVFGTIAAFLAAVLLTLALRRARPAVQTIFWLVVLVKFVVPVGPGWSWSLSSVAHRVGNTAGLSSLWRASQPPATEAPAVPKMATYTYLLAPAPAAAPGSSNPAPAPAAVSSSVPWPMVVAATYLLAVIALAALRVASYRRLAWRAARLPAAAPEIAGRVAELCARAGVRRVPDIRVSDESPAPFIFGALRPVLVLSRRQLADDDELGAVVLHEIAHLRRGDLWVRHLQWLAGTLLFFWPVVAWVNRRIDLAREHACDEWALRHGTLSPARYARCLLRAMQPAAGWRLFRPAAMAVDAQHVERRIEMILRADQPARFRRSGAMLALVLPVAWSAFVLTSAGAASSGALRATEKQSTVDLPDDELVFFMNDEDCGGIQFEINLVGGFEGLDCDSGALLRLSTDCDDALPMISLSGAAPQGAMMWINDGQDGGAEAIHTFGFQIAGAGGSESLDGFLGEHPTADADGDGALTQAERDAYLMALALREPARVIAQYPKSDTNGDGRLSDQEAALLLYVPPFEPPAGAGAWKGMVADGAPGAAVQVKRMRVVLRGAAEATEPADEAQPAEAGAIVRSGVRIERQEEVTDDGSGQPQRRVIVRHIGAADDAEPVAVKSAADDLPLPPQFWLPRNIAATPTAAEVARLVSLAEEAPLTAFLHMNPQADANHDGRLTQAERDAFVESQSTRMRSKILERHPEADANGDGMLTEDEMHGFFRSRHGNAVSGRRMMIMRGGDGAAAGSIAVEANVEVETSDGSGDEK